jgi:hypothetical protein
LEKGPSAENLELIYSYVDMNLIIGDYKRCP